MRRETKKGRKLVVFALMVAVMLCVSACGAKETAENKVYKIGISQIADHPSLDNCRKGFIDGLKNKGFVEGKNLEVTNKSAQGDMDVATQISQSFVSKKMDLVCGIATPTAQSLYSACFEKNIPVVFNAVSDPVMAKLAKSKTEAMPGISGISDELPVEEQLKLIRALMPDAKNIGILYTTSEENSLSTIETYKSLASKYGFELTVKGIGNEADIPAALDVILPKVDCMTNLTDNTVVANLSVVLQKANEKNIPVFGSEEEQVKNGCIASAGLDYYKLGVQAGEMAARVLNGEDISKIPFETLKESTNTVNTSVAKKLNITVPSEILSSATSVQ